MKKKIEIKWKKKIRKKKKTLKATEYSLLKYIE